MVSRGLGGEQATGSDRPFADVAPGKGYAGRAVSVPDVAAKRNVAGVNREGHRREADCEPQLRLRWQPNHGVALHSQAVTDIRIQLERELRFGEWECERALPRH